MIKKINPKYYINSSSVSSANFYFNKAFEYINYALMELDTLDLGSEEIVNIKKNIVILEDKIRRKMYENENYGGSK